MFKPTCDRPAADRMSASLPQLAARGCGWIWLLLLLLPLYATASTLQQRLEMADTYRFNDQPTKTVTEVKEFKAGQMAKTQLYDVYSKPGKGSLAVFKSAAQAGQKVLMQQDNFWIFMPKTRQPLRISPMQKLMGDASVGDLATQSWSDAYQASAVAVGEVPTPLAADEVAIWLDARISGVSYQRILLVLSAADNFPLRAWFYLKSGKLAKYATFERGELHHQPWISAMTFENSMQPGNKTIMTLTAIEKMPLDDKIFNPAFLLRSNLADF
jgi:hypothetical protein